MHLKKHRVNARKDDISKSCGSFRLKITDSIREAWRLQNDQKQ